MYKYDPIEEVEFVYKEIKDKIFDAKDVFKRQLKLGTL